MIRFWRHKLSIYTIKTMVTLFCHPFALPPTWCLKPKTEWWKCLIFSSKTQESGMFFPRVSWIKSSQIFVLPFAQICLSVCNRLHTNAKFPLEKHLFCHNSYIAITYVNVIIQKVKESFPFCLVKSTVWKYMHQLYISEVMTITSMQKNQCCYPVCSLQCVSCDSDAIKLQLTHYTYSGHKHFFF